MTEKRKTLVLLSAGIALAMSALVIWVSWYDRTIRLPDGSLLSIERVTYGGQRLWFEPLLHKLARRLMPSGGFLGFRFGPALPQAGFPLAAPQVFGPITLTNIALRSWTTHDTLSAWFTVETADAGTDAFEYLRDLKYTLQFGERTLLARSVEFRKQSGGGAMRFGISFVGFPPNTNSFTIRIEDPAVSGGRILGEFSFRNAVPEPQRMVFQRNSNYWRFPAPKWSVS